MLKVKTLEFAKKGFTVYGIDLLREKINMLKRGKSYIVDVKNIDLREVIKKGKLIPTTDYSVMKKVDCVSIAVPTPLQKSKDPDVSYINSSMNNIKK